MKKLLLKVWVIIAISFLAMNVAGQESYTTGYPNVDNIAQETATLNVSATVGGEENTGTASRPKWEPTHFAEFVIFNSVDPAPTIQNVIDWAWDGNGGAIPEGMYGEIGLTSSNTEFSFDVSGLSPETDYVAYFVTVENDFTTVVIETVSATAVPFTTLAPPAPLTATLNPLDNAPNVSVNTTSFVLTFSEAIQFNSSGTYIIRLYESGNPTPLANRYIDSGTPQDGLLIDVLNNTLSIDFGYQLDYSKEYYITIPADAIQSVLTSVSYEGLAINEWSFTTETQPLELTLRSPEDGATNVPLTESLVATFNQNIQFATGAEVTVYNYDGDVFIESMAPGAGLSISGMELSINPIADFAEGTRYYVVIPSGAIETTTALPFTGVTLKDEWDFTTEYLPLSSPTLNPLDGATGIPRNAILEVVFDKDIEFGIGGNVEIYTGTTQAKLFNKNSSELSIVNSNTLRIDLSGNPLVDYATLYDVRISSDIIKRVGSEVYFTGFAAGEWAFTTEAQPLDLTLTTPADGSTGMQLTESLVATFNQNIQLAAGASISVFAYEGDVLFETLTASPGLSVTGMELTINPTADFAEGTRYYVIIPDGAVESTTGTPFSGVTLKDNWDFTTTSLPPAVVSYDPNGLSAVAIDKVLNLTFDRPIKLNASSIHTVRIARYTDDSTYELYYINGSETDELLTVSGNVLTITPPTNYESSTLYYVEISNGAILSLSDVPFAGISNKDTWSFSTVVAATAPEIVSGGYSPAPSTTEVSRNPVLELTFDENIAIGNSGYFWIFTSLDDVERYLIPRSQVSVVDNKLTVSLSNISLIYGTQYYVTIDPGFVKSSTTGVDFGGISTSTEWFFTTETAPPFWAEGYPVVTGQNTTKFDLNAMADVTGIVHAVVTGTSDVPSEAQISSGQNSSSEPARLFRNEAVGSTVTPTTVQFLFDEEIPTGVNYYLHTVFENEGKYSSIETITIDRIIPEINQEKSLPNLDDSTVSITDHVVIVFKEPVFGFNESGTLPLDNSYFSFHYDDAGTPVDVAYTLTVTTTIEETTVVLQPDAILIEDKEYFITIAPVSDANGNLTNEVIRTFETDKNNIWIGGGDVTDWNDALNWSSGAYVANKTVVIPYLVSGNYPSLMVDSIYTVFNLIIEPGALLTHQVGSLKVNGVFNLQSSADYNASYIGGGFLDVTDGIVRIDQVIPNPNGSYLISSPVSGATQSNIGTTGPVMYYDNATDSWNAINSVEEMNGGYGYVTWSNSDLHFSGDINIGNFNVPVVRNDGQGYGWNYVGNPYTASIDWDLLEIDNLELEDAFWIWDTSNDRYGVYNYESGIHINISSSIIPSNHGFLVKVKDDVFSASLPISPSAIVQNTSSYIKSGRVKNEYEHVKLAGVNGTSRDEVAVVFVETATEGVDKFDSEKLFSGKDNILQLFTRVGDMKSAINSFPFSNNKEVPLGFSVGVPGEYSIEMVTNKLEAKQVFLIDKELNRMEDITNGGSYSFSVSKKGQNISRFSLKFVGQVSTGEFVSDSKDDFRYYVEKNNVFVMVEEAWIGFPYRILDINGRIINSKKLTGSGFVNLGNYSRGVYFVEITNNNKEIIRIEKIAVY